MLFRRLGIHMVRRSVPLQRGPTIHRALLHVLPSSSSLFFSSASSASSCVLPTVHAAVSPKRSFHATSQTKGVPHTKIEDVFGQNSFNARAQRQFLPPQVFEKITRLVHTHQPIDEELTEKFASALHRWAKEQGATHYTHWFTPLTNRSASKHDSFMQRADDHVISTFSGKTLALGEPDGSSFPGGGLRHTHEARGYTVWDPSSPCFIINHGTGSTLYIPSVFVTWKGNSLDEKTPLLRSNEALNREGLRMFRAAGDESHEYVRTDSGIEQEFFLIDSDYVLKRPDILQCGRTLLGRAPPRGQQLDDQYFADLSERTMRLINEAEIELWKLGIPQTTRHKEVAPAQYEIAPVFSSSTIAADQNLLSMEVLDRVAHHHGMEVLRHEKPFAGLNGSGKHNNWSVGTNKVGTVFNPGKNPHKNAMFMLWLAATVRSCDVHQDVLRISVTSASNDHRLGAQEAPPAIMSVYLGSDIDGAVAQFLAEDVNDNIPTEHTSIGFSCLPVIKTHPTDRNRTSPFAFTGNKFEFRAVGSSQMAHRSSFMLNTIVADSCRVLSDEIEGRTPEGATNEEKEVIAMQVARETLRKHGRIIFGGDCYSEEWHAEASKRGLLNLVRSPDCLRELTSEKNLALFGDLRVLSPAGMHARSNVWLEEYTTKRVMEANALSQIINTQVLPAAYKLQTSLAGSIISTESCKINVSDAQRSRLQTVSDVIGTLVRETEELERVKDDVANREDLQSAADHAADLILPQLERVAQAANTLEGICDAESWPLPNYHEMLFTGQTYDV